MQAGSCTDLRNQAARAAHLSVRLPAHALPVLPCSLTLCGLLCGVQGALSVTSGEVGLAVLWMTAGQACDIADGWTARQLGAVTRGGALLDIMTDRALAVAFVAAAGAWWALPILVLLQTWAGATERKISGRTFAAVVALATCALRSMGHG